MATYVVLGKFTQQGVATVKESRSRREAAQQAIQAAGGSLPHVYYTMGQYDLVAIVEAPDDETATRVALGTAGAGNVRTETLRAFTESEFDSIVAGLP